jgi:hypothetical protein
MEGYGDAAEIASFSFASAVTSSLAGLELM